MSLKKHLLIAGCAAICAGSANAAPYPRSSTPAAIDLGVAQSVPDQSKITLTVSLNLRNRAELESLLDSMYQKGNAEYRHFLTPAQFAAKFGPSAATIAKVTGHFEAAGFTVKRLATTHLEVSGDAAAMQREFGVELHAYEVPATATTPSYRYHASLSKATLAADIAGDVESVVGFDTRPAMRPHFVHEAPTGSFRDLKPVESAGATHTTDAPGYWTVKDFAEYYNVEPLYAQGLNGHKQTIGIMTYAALTPSDAFTYWSALGLNVSANRLTQVMVDGGSGPPSDASGSIETTLDVEQSGGIAPSANILVYEAPNTVKGNVDLFAKVFDANAAGTISYSWGSWEYDNEVQTLNPVTGKITTVNAALNSLLMQAVSQGQTVITSAADAGAYTADQGYPAPEFTKTLSVDSPASSPYITAAGGTTLPGKQTYLITTPAGTTDTVTINVVAEQVWGFDYLSPLCTALGVPDPTRCGIFPGGGGGGVSVLFPVPSYQAGLPGIQVSQPDQVLIDETTSPPTVLDILPAGYAGRNVPDVSFNSDPETGYVIYYTSDTGGPFINPYYGGTSFAAPQLNGMSSLINQGLGHRVGFLNVPLYDMVRSGTAYTGAAPPLRDITHGDNWFYFGSTGYDPGSGVGVPNVSNLFEALK